MVLSSGCTCLRSALPLARARSAPTQQNLHSPTEFKTHSCWDILPQISQNTQNFLAEIFSHRFHTQKLWCFQGGALVSSAPTQQNLYSPTEFRTHSCWDILPQIYTEIFAEKTPTDFTEHTELLLRKLPQISQNTQNFLAEIFSHRFHRFTQNFLAGKNSVKSVDSVGDIHALTSVRICEICGSFSTANLG